VELPERVSAKRILSLSLLLVCVALQASAGPLLGRAIIAAQRGGAVYEQEAGSEPLEEGMALTQGTRIRTDEDAALCVLLSPGALVCVYANTTFDLTKLEHSSDGLPGAGSPEIGRIGLTLLRGAILVHAGPPVTDRTITLTLDSRTKGTLAGGTVTLISEHDRRCVQVEKGVFAVDYGGETEVYGAGAPVLLQVREGNEWIRPGHPTRETRLPYHSHVYRKLFRSLEPFAFGWDWSNMGALGNWISAKAGIRYVGAPPDWQDVSPSVRRTVVERYMASGSPPPGIAGAAGQWKRSDVWDWYRGVGTLRGVNYLPRTAVNTIEMWQSDNFDPETIDQELGWASGTADLDGVRVFLPYVVWAADRKGLKKRMRQFLDIADGHDLTTTFVLFDDRQAPGTPVRVGPQPDPVANIHNSRWTGSPGHALVPEEAGAWTELKAYVEDVVDTFANDSRVLLWDVYNEPGDSGMGVVSMPLVEAAFRWVRSVGPDQPVSAGIGHMLSLEDRQRIMELSDVVTLSGYEGAEQMKSILSLASTRGRPVICTGWLSRERGNTFEDILPVFSEFGVGWYHWGLVQGRSQLFAPMPGADPDLWKQDLLNDKGEPFDEDEIELIKGFSFRGN
jgi:hypothetical protein